MFVKLNILVITLFMCTYPTRMRKRKEEEIQRVSKRFKEKKRFKNIQREE